MVGSSRGNTGETSWWRAWSLPGRVIGPDSTMKFLLCFLCLILPFLSDGATHLVRREALPSPQRGGGRSISGRPQNRFIFGQAGNAGLAGAALGAATQYFANQIFNPCRRAGNRRGNTNNRFRIVLFTLLF